MILLSLLVIIKFTGFKNKNNLIIFSLNNFVDKNPKNTKIINNTLNFLYKLWLDTSNKEFSMKI